MNELAWMNAAACKGASVDVMFPGRESSEQKVADHYCTRCPVVAECLEDALTVRDDDGVRGGMTGQDRKRLRRRLRRRLAQADGLREAAAAVRRGAVA